MEKSHKQERVAYHKSTQRGGGSTLLYPLVQMFQWFYRCVVSRFIKEVVSSSEHLVE